MRDHAKKEAEKRKKGEQVTYFKPEGWAGDPFDYEGFHTAFQRDQANQYMLDAIKDANSPGVVGDVVATATMINYLSVMERAFRVRHTLRRTRGTAHSIGRKQGQGNDNGPFIQLGVEYINSVLKQAKKAQ